MILINFWKWNTFLLNIHYNIYSIRNFRISRSAAWHLGPKHEQQKDGHDRQWINRYDGHDSGYMIEKDGHHQKNIAAFNHAIKEESEQHALKSAAGAGKHTAGSAEKGASKHADQASALGKDVKAKTFGFFDYQYKQPEYHVEQFYTDEKHGRKFGADRLHHSLKDHESDAHEASGWGKHGKGYHNDAHGIDARENGAKHHYNWKNDFHKGYGKEDEIDYSKGRGAHEQYSHHDVVVPERHDHHHYHHNHKDHNGWAVPAERGYGYELNLWDYPEERSTWGKWGHGWGHIWH
ncbi:unnamed protein product [Thelazia callipaeda]|uniref:Histidine-rich glycoprotein-like n=1 Tax=Thelazia callipaeda TaxID=103827 RepID=A0A0N5CYB8_THECL|nr:unnamed protein product [Thelazia callipaeda]